jgi:hypothetical protein
VEQIERDPHTALRVGIAREREPHDQRVTFSLEMALPLAPFYSNMPTQHAQQRASGGAPQYGVHAVVMYLL